MGRPAMATKRDGRARNGGARPGAGRPPTAVPLTAPTMAYLRAATRARLGRPDVLLEDIAATLESIVSAPPIADSGAIKALNNAINELYPRQSPPETMMQRAALDAVAALMGYRPARPDERRRWFRHEDIGVFVHLYAHSESGAFVVGHDDWHARRVWFGDAREYIAVEVRSPTGPEDDR